MLVSGGNVSLSAASGLVAVNANGSVSTSSGNISIVAGQQFTFGSGEISATEGDVTITIGPFDSAENHSKPAGVNVNPPAAENQVFWGTNSIDVIGSNNNININGSGTVIFDTNGEPKERIRLGDNSVVAAG